MKHSNIFLSQHNDSRGSVLVELLLSVALAAVVIPFIFKYHENSLRRTQNIAIVNQMTELQVALERYIIENRDTLLQTVGRNITRVSVADLAPYGVPETILSQGDEKYQLRILKSNDVNDSASLQGVIVRVSDDVSPLRTREIVRLSGGTMGFVDGTRAHGSFGAWHTDSIDLGTDIDNGIIETTSVNRDGALYLWRVPSGDPSDATMMTALNLAGHDVVNATFLNADFSDFTEGMTSKTIVSDTTTFQHRTNLDGIFETASATVSGMLSSDSKNMQVSGSYTLSDTAKLSSLNANNLWVTNMTLGDISVDSSDDFALLKINQTLDMTSGRIDAMFVTVGYTGSMTSRLVVFDRIEDPVDSSYYWDAGSKIASFQDATFVELNRMAGLAVLTEDGTATQSGQIFSSVSSNKNATVSDYMSALQEIQTRVIGKYRRLNLE